MLSSRRASGRVDHPGVLPRPVLLLGTDDPNGLSEAIRRFSYG